MNTIANTHYENNEPLNLHSRGEDPGDERYYDVIGDVHGNVEKLVALLKNMDYEIVDGVWRHPTRTAIFAGDLIDRCKNQLAVLTIVRNMVNAGAALVIMGNHEYNAIAYHLPDPLAPGHFLRPRNTKNRDQHEAFLAEVEHDPVAHQDWIDWFLQIPLWLDLPGLRVVHACWHQQCIDELQPHLLPGNLLSPELVERASRKDSDLYRCVETITKGPETRLPEGHSFLDPNGSVRRVVRIRWWDRRATSYRKAALLSAEAAAKLPDLMLPDGFELGYRGEKPVIFGHYWMHGTPVPLAHNVACVDYSAGKKGDLVAYRWSGEKMLVAENFCSSASHLEVKNTHSMFHKSFEHGY